MDEAECAQGVESLVQVSDAPVSSGFRRADGADLIQDVMQERRVDLGYGGRVLGQAVAQAQLARQLALA